MVYTPAAQLWNREAIVPVVGKTIPSSSIPMFEKVEEGRRKERATIVIYSFFCHH
jgi:hypothetical protein